jgi:hypothetical protein
MSHVRFWSAWLSLISSITLSVAHGQGCSCATTNWYNSVKLPSLIVQNTCPEWPAVLTDNPIKGVNSPLPEVTGYIYLKDSFTAAHKGQNIDFTSVTGGKNQTCTASYLNQETFATGWNVLVINRWYTLLHGKTSFKLQDGIITDFSSQFLYPVADESAAALQQMFRRQGRGRQPNLTGITVTRFPTYYNWFYHRSSKADKELYSISLASLLSDITKTLTSNGWTDFTVGMVNTKEGLFPAVIKLWGNRQNVYAYYGRFTDGEQAKQLGFNTSDQLYFSRPDIYPQQSTELMGAGMRYGSKIFTSSQEVISNRDQFEWYTECRCSDMPYQPDPDNNPTVSATSNWTPISPNNLEQNRNILQLRECPDNIQYASLFEKCVSNLLGDDDLRANPRDRTDYGDYLASKMSEDPNFKSVTPEGTIETEALSIDNMPQTPAYYDHEGNRLNPNSSDKSDPLDRSTYFYARGFEGGFLGIGEDEVDIDVTQEIRPVMYRMRNLYNSHVSLGRDGILDLFGLSPDYHGEDLQFSKNFQDLELTLTVENVQYFKLNWMFLNTLDKYLPFRTPQIFITQSLTGVPIKVTTYDDNLFSREYQKFNLSWAYNIYYKNNYGDPYKIGTLAVKYYAHYNWDAQDWSMSTHQIRMDGEKTIPSADSYDLTSKEAHTDLKDLHERDPESFDKSEAMAKIAFYIAVSEGLDMGMKWIYQQRDKPYAYEAAKRFDNMASTKMSKKLAISLYKGYVEWRRLMDILRDIRDTRRSLERSFTRFKQAGHLIFDYYSNLDYSKIRPTNLTVLYPTRAIRYFDFAANNLAYDVNHFEFAAHAMALDLDRFLNGPGLATVAYMQREFLSSLSTVDGENEHQREMNHQALQGAMQTVGKSDQNNSNYIRLSAITRLAIQRTQNLQVKSLEASTTGLRNVLTGIQSDSRDWLTMGDYVTENLAGTPSALMQSFEKRKPTPVANQMKVGTIFNNKWVDEKLEAAP